MESRGRTGQPDRAASLVGCTEGRQLPAGLPPPRIIRDEGEKESSSKRHLQERGKGGQRERVKRVVARVRGEGPESRPARKARRKKRALKEARCVKPKSYERKRKKEGERERVIPRRFSADWLI